MNGSQLLHKNDDYTHDTLTTKKSSQFHMSRRYVKSDRMKPRANILTQLSTVYIDVKISLQVHHS